MRHAHRLGITLWAALCWALCWGCSGDAKVVDYCLSDAGACPPCTSNAQCGFTGNPCLESVYCAHREASIAVADLGCSEALEYSWPDDEECACVGSVCRYVEE